MENFKVRLVEEADNKGVAEREAELLAKHEAEQAAADAAAQAAAAQAAAAQNEPPVDTPPAPPAEPDLPELKEEDVLSFINKRYNKTINSFDELVAERNNNEELPEDVAAFMKFKKETGRGFDDFLKLRKDYDSMDQNDLLRDYLSATQEGLDPEDISTLMEEYQYNEDFDDDSTIKKVKIARKKVIAEAKKFFADQKEKYKLPLESSGGMSQEDKQELEQFRQYISQSKTQQEEADRKRQWFDKKTSDLFNQEFKGFEFEIDNKKLLFSPGDVNELKKNQSTPANFINKFLDENGMMKDASGYHRSLAIAMNPDKFAKFFYEQGLSDATDKVTRTIKNVNMSDQRVPQNSRIADGVQVKAVNPDSGRQLKIRSAKKL